ncbi:MAG: hypothetical protein JW759_04710 [Candidatus Coatesbacteria bacterium]|nr:hypothetical protein [Candidatus Coatesbacteria bacterium]
MKERPHHKLYQMFRSMSPEARMLKCFELSDFVRELFLDGLRKRFPDKTEDEIKTIYFKRLEKCHNRNYQEVSCGRLNGP